MMKNYIVNCDKIKFFQTFKSFDLAIKCLTEINELSFDGEKFSTFGRGQIQDCNDEGEIIWLDASYYIDSVVLCPKNEPNNYHTFFIRCIDENGKQIEL